MKTLFFQKLIGCNFYFFSFLFFFFFFSFLLFLLLFLFHANFFTSSPCFFFFLLFYYVFGLLRIWVGYYQLKKLLPVELKSELGDQATCKCSKWPACKRSGSVGRAWTLQCFSIILFQKADTCKSISTTNYIKSEICSKKIVSNTRFIFDQYHSSSTHLVYEIVILKISSYIYSIYFLFFPITYICVIPYNLICMLFQFQARRLADVIKKYCGIWKLVKTRLQKVC